MSVKPTVLKRPENDVTERNTTDRNVATLETAPTRYVEGGGRDKIATPVRAIETQAP